MAGTSTRWAIDNLQWESTTGAVRSCIYSVHVFDDSVTGTYSARVEFEPNPSSPNFIPVGELTEDIVLGWVKASFDIGYDKIIEDMALEDFTRKNVPPMVSGIPWGHSV